MPAESNYLVSVIIPVYNRAKVIGRSIDSVLKQTYHNFELILVDDGSTDNLTTELGQYKDSRIKKYKLSQNMGVSSARNLGISKCNGRFVVFLDSDDELNPKYIHKMISELLNSDHSMAVCRAKYDNNKIYPVLLRFNGFFKSNSKIDYLLMGNILPLPCILFSNKIVKKINFDINMKSYEDFDFILHAIMNNDDIKRVDDVLVKVNDSIDSVNKNINAIFYSLMIIKDKFKEQLKANKKTDFYFKKNLLSICKRQISISQKFSIIIDLVINLEFPLFIINRLSGSNPKKLKKNET